MADRQWDALSSVLHASSASHAASVAADAPAVGSSTASSTSPALGTTASHSVPRSSDDVVDWWQQPIEKKLFGNKFDMKLTYGYIAFVLCFHCCAAQCLRSLSFNDVHDCLLYFAAMSERDRLIALIAWFAACGGDYAIRRSGKLVKACLVAMGFSTGVGHNKLTYSRRCQREHIELAHDFRLPAFRELKVPQKDLLQRWIAEELVPSHFLPSSEVPEVQYVTHPLTFCEAYRVYCQYLTHARATEMTTGVLQTTPLSYKTFVTFLREKYVGSAWCG
jgi:hypothetical protein